MKAKQLVAVLILIGISSLITKVYAQSDNMHSDHVMVTPAEIKWVDAPNSLPPGAKVAIIDGDPKVAGLFTMRIQMPPGYKIMPHTHPADEHVTVLEGTGNMGLGQKYDEKSATALPVGAFAMMKVGTAHYYYTTTGCTIQLHGMGPWGIKYINPADDPRNK